VLAALFASESIERKRNTEAIEVGPSQLVSARILHFSPGRALTLDEAREQLTRDWVADRATALARQKGAEALKAWQGQPAAAKLESGLTVSRDQPASVPPAVLDAALRAPSNKLPAWVGVDLGEQGYAVVKVNQVMAAQNLDQRKAERAQLSQASANAQASAYLESLKTQFKARILVAKPTGT
jgi:peptidyl-prolyl cis-trans isomerase D